MADMEQPILSEEGRKSSRELRKGYSSHWHVPKEHHLGGISEDALKRGFRVKVDGILTLQMFITMVICATFMVNPALQGFAISLAQGGAVVRWGSLIVECVLLAALHFMKDEYPLNMFLLVAFTVMIATDIGMVCALFAAAGIGLIVAQATGVTFYIFFALSIFTIYSKRSFHWRKGFRLTGLLGMVAMGFVGLFYPSLVTHMVYSVCGALLFSGYIVFDMWRIEQVFGPDDYIPAAIELDLDIIDLFFYILHILAESESWRGQHESILAA